MGDLHDGHLALVRRSREVAPFTVVSIFVNPFQFGEGEDFDSYPRSTETDIERLEALDVDLVFLPPVSEIYPAGPENSTRVEVPGLGSVLCGAMRPTFFRGVATVVTMLLNAVQPHVALFGEKDYQQLLVVRRLVDHLKLPVAVESVPTVREADGLAMSSRNRYLGPANRSRAPVFVPLPPRSGGANPERRARLPCARSALHEGARKRAGFPAGLLQLRDGPKISLRRPLMRRNWSFLPRPGSGAPGSSTTLPARFDRLIDNVSCTLDASLAPPGLPYGTVLRRTQAQEDRWRKPPSGGGARAQATGLVDARLPRESSWYGRGDSNPQALADSGF